ncbi:MAG TPA: PP2C family protein-serine/threonine phosphatase [Thermoanaerobaculia bacterium]|nr:PP2C family protein-serine/threonine phosphatase [Thermoanaerobaculia bacterium]
MLQSALFAPSLPPCCPAAVDVHAVSIPARTFTGDFWFTHRAGDRLWFALGDVAGKGLPAAVVMALIQEELEQQITSCARRGCDPAVTVQRLHEYLRPLMPRNRFATMVLGWIRDDGAMRLTNGGHCPPLILRADGRIEPIHSTGPAVGVLPVSRWRSQTLSLAPGETLLLYSDGVIEATSEHGAEFGTQGIVRALRHQPSSAGEVAAAVVDAVRVHAGGRREDDLTVLVMARG